MNPPSRDHHELPWSLVEGERLDAVEVEELIAEVGVEVDVLSEERAGRDRNG